MNLWMTEALRRNACAKATEVLRDPQLRQQAVHQLNALLHQSNLLGSTLADDVEISLRGTVSTDYVSMDRVRLSYGGSASLAQVAGGP